MAFALSKEARKERDDLVKKVNDAQSELSATIETANEVLEEQRNYVDDAQNAYNEALAELRAFRDERVTEWREDYDSRSDKWQESERASEVAGWIDEWESADLDDVEITMPDEFDMPDMDHAETIADLADSATEDA